MPNPNGKRLGGVGKSYPTPAQQSAALEAQRRAEAKRYEAQSEYERLALADSAAGKPCTVGMLCVAVLGALFLGSLIIALWGCVAGGVTQ